MDFRQDSSDLATTLATLQSRFFTLKFISTHNLKPLLFKERWSTDTNSWLSPTDVPSDAEAIKRFDAIRVVSEDRSTGLVRIAITWEDRHLAAEWANGLVLDLNAHLRAKAIEEAERSSSYLKREVEKTSIVELQQAIFELIEIQINKIMLANVREEFALKIVDPAIVADEGDYSTPRRLLVIASGGLVALLIGFFAAFVRHNYRQG